MTQSTKTHLMMFSLMAVVFMMPDFAAASDNPIALMLCNVVGWITGTVGAAIATIAIIVIGLGALLGKVSWGMALIVGLGIAIIFGAQTIVGFIAGTDSEVACNGGDVGAP